MFDKAVYMKAYRLKNLDKIRARQRADYYKHHEVRRTKAREAGLKVRLKHRYGMSVEQYETLHEQQDGKCAICGKEQEDRRLAVDHDHKTGLNRGLLCIECNRAIGLFHDNPDACAAAAEYLRRYAFTSNGDRN